MGSDIDSDGSSERSALASDGELHGIIKFQNSD
jgi:hypothetical protein